MNILSHGFVVDGKGHQMPRSPECNYSRDYIKNKDTWNR